MHKLRALISSPNPLPYFARSAAARIACVMAAVVVTLPAATGAARVFSDGFESGGVEQWTQNGNRDMCIAVSKSADGVAPHSGKYMVECNWNGLVNWDAHNAFSTLVLNTWNYNHEFFVRFWIRAATDCAHSYGDKIMRLWSADPTKTQMTMAFAFDSPPAQGLTGQLIMNGVESSFGDYNTTFGGDNAWHKVEIYFKENDPGVSNGTWRLWQDGLLRHEKLNAVTATPGLKWSGMYLLSNWSNNGPQWVHGANNHVNFDDIEIYSDAGSGATGLMSDASITSASTLLTAPAAAKPDPPAKVGVK